MEILNGDTLDSIIKQLNFKDSDADKIEDSELRKLLTYIRVLGELETETLAGKTSLIIDSLFYSRYYWFNQFKERYYSLFGHDEGLEQQSFKMLSDYNERFPENIDWNIIEHIESNSI